MNKEKFDKNNKEHMIIYTNDTQNDSIKVKDKIFNDKDLFDKFKYITFENCDINCDFKHIFCKEIKFINCKIQNYYLVNPSIEKWKIENLFFYNCEITSLELEGLILENNLIKIDDYEKAKISSLTLKNCEIKKDFVIDSSGSDKFHIENLDFENSEFDKDVKVKIKNCDITNSNFYNTKFKDLADFHQSCFKKVNFERSDFEDIAIFSECVFRQNIDFKYTKFSEKAIFKDTVFQKVLDLRNTIFKEEADFLGVTSKQGYIEDIKVKNRETARIIKNLFDKAGNIIEANVFYKLEMDKRREELDKNGSLKDKIIFFLHRYSSNHSQDWFLALFWIIYFTIFTSSVKCIGFICSVFIFVIPFAIFLYCKKSQNISHKFLFVILIILFTLYIIAVKDYNLEFFTKIYSSIFKIGKNKCLIDLVYKIVMAYLIYQFVISVRQNTRRK